MKAQKKVQQYQEYLTSGKAIIAGEDASAEQIHAFAKHTLAFMGAIRRGVSLDSRVHDFIQYKLSYPFDRKRLQGISDCSLKKHPECVMTLTVAWLEAREKEKEILSQDRIPNRANSESLRLAVNQ